MRNNRGERIDGRRVPSAVIFRKKTPGNAVFCGPFWKTYCDCGALHF